MSGKHHNAFFPSGFDNLKKAMVENHLQLPNKEFTPINIIAEGDLVAMHSRLVLKKGDQRMAVVHIFRFKDDKIVEMWDCGQAIPADSPNKDGAF
jgi:predicted SnoaL-like aldol condensation-catalyzing enzyme